MMPKEVRDSGETPIDPTEITLRADREDLRFLGREFLTWLLFHAEEEDGLFRSDDGVVGSFRIGFGERMKLASPLSSELVECTLRGPSPSSSRDVRFAVAGGLSVREADLVLLFGDRSFGFSLVSDTFDLKKVELPTLLVEASDGEEAFVERIALLGELDSCVHAAFRHFLSLRLSSVWGTEVISAMGSWLRSSLEKDAEIA